MEKGVFLENSRDVKVEEALFFGKSEKIKVEE